MKQCFKCNDKIFSLRRGVGVIMFIELRDDNYPIKVLFKNGIIDWYTIDGKLYVSALHLDQDYIIKAHPINTRFNQLKEKHV